LKDLELDLTNLLLISISKEDKKEESLFPE
jgi:hypothetical protein